MTHTTETNQSPLSIISLTFYNTFSSSHFSTQKSPRIVPSTRAHGPVNTTSTSAAGSCFASTPTPALRHWDLSPAASPSFRHVLSDRTFNPTSSITPTTTNDARRHERRKKFALGTCERGLWRATKNCKRRGSRRKEAGGSFLPSRSRLHSHNNLDHGSHAHHAFRVEQSALGSALAKSNAAF